MWKTVERTVARDELDAIACICRTTRQTTGEVAKHATLTNEHDDERAERTSEPDDGFDTTSRTTGDFSAV